MSEHHIRLKPGPTAKPVTHGRRYTYLRYGCRCEACTAANTEYHRAYRERPGVIERELRSTAAGRDAEQRWQQHQAAIEALI